MKIDFRQGIIKARNNVGTPDFLEYNPQNNSMTIDITDVPLVVSVAHKNADYTIEHRETHVNAFGPLEWKAAWGPEQNTPTYHFYWDIHMATGQVTTGYTPNAPMYGFAKPTNPAIDQHYFDLNDKVMYVYNGTQWVPKIRVFAGSIALGFQVIVHQPFGTQINYSNAAGTMIEPEINSGYILYGMDMKAIRTPEGLFCTTTTPVVTNHGSFSSPIRLELANSQATAAEPIPAFYCVTNLGDDTVGLASGYSPAKRAIGVADIPAGIGHAVTYVSNGLLYSDSWNWDVSLGKDLYCGPTGQLIQGAPVGSDNTPNQRIGTIIGPKTILVQIDLYGNGGIGPTGPAGTNSLTEKFVFLTGPGFYNVLPEDNGTIFCCDPHTYPDGDPVVHSMYLDDPFWVDPDANYSNDNMAQLATDLQLTYTPDQHSIDNYGYDSWYITQNNSTTYSVYRDISGDPNSYPDLTLGVPYDNGIIALTIPITGNFQRPGIESGASLTLSFGYNFRGGNIEIILPHSTPLADPVGIKVYVVNPGSLPPIPAEPAALAGVIATKGSTLQQAPSASKLAKPRSSQPFKATTGTFQLDNLIGASAPESNGMSDGTGYLVNDLLTLVGGTYTTPAVIRVDSVGWINESGVGGYTIIEPGEYTVPPQGPVSVTGGSGHGATFMPVWIDVGSNAANGVDYLNIQLPLSANDFGTVTVTAVPGDMLIDERTDFSKPAPFKPNAVPGGLTRGNSLDLRAGNYMQISTMEVSDPDGVTPYKAWFIENLKAGPNLQWQMWEGTTSDAYGGYYTNMYNNETRDFGFSQINVVAWNQRQDDVGQFVETASGMYGSEYSGFVPNNTGLHMVDLSFEYALTSAWCGPTSGIQPASVIIEAQPYNGGGYMNSTGFRDEVIISFANLDNWETRTAQMTRICYLEAGVLYKFSYTVRGLDENGYGASMVGMRNARIVYLSGGQQIEPDMNMKAMRDAYKAQLAAKKAELKAKHEANTGGTTPPNA